MLQAAGAADQSAHAIARERPRDALTPDFRAEWRRLAENAAEPNAFAEEWFVCPALTHLDGDAVRLVEVRSLSGELIGVIPLATHRNYGRIPVMHVRNWVHFQCFMGAPLVRAGSETAFWSAVIDLLDASAWARGFLSIAELAEDGPLHRGLTATTKQANRPCAVVHRYERAILESANDAEGYLAGALSGKKRKELRRLSARLAESGPVVFETLGDGGDLPSWCADFLALEASGWKGERGAALANTPETQAFFGEIMVGAHAAGRLDFQRLTLSGRPIAMLVNFRTPPGSWSFKIAYDEALARFSPGVMIELENLARVLADPELDWMDSCAVADHPMIERLWRERRRMVQVTLPLSGIWRRLVHDLCRLAEDASALLRGRVRG